MKIRESDIIDIDIPEQEKEDPLKCPFCGHVSEYNAPVKWDKKTECYICFKCGIEWVMRDGKPVKLKVW